MFKSQSKKNIFPGKEKLGFDIKVKRFKDEMNKNPGPGEYFKGKNNNKKIEEAKGRVDYQGYIFPRRRGESVSDFSFFLCIPKSGKHK